MGRHGDAPDLDGPRGLLRAVRAAPAAMFWPRRVGSGRPTFRYDLIFVGFIVPLAVAIIILPRGFSDIRPSWAAAHNRGVHGSLTVNEFDCSGRGSCQPMGTFVSDDGTVALEHAHLADAGLHPAEHRNDAVRTTWQGQRNQPLVYREGAAHMQFGYLLILLGVALAAALWCVFCVTEAVVRTSRTLWDRRASA